MSFYQEYLKKQKERESNGKIEKRLEKTEQFADGEKFSDIQKKEEMERKAFMDRVGGKDIPEPLIIKDTPEENLKIIVSQKPTKSDKFLIRLIVILALLALLGSISFFWYRAIQEGRDPVEIIREVEVEKEVFVSEVIAPKSLFNYDRFEYPLITRPNEFTAHFLQYMNQEVNQEAIVKVMFRDQRDPANPTFTPTNQFLNTFLITMPSPFNDRVDQESLNTFVHLREGGNEAGFAVVIKEVDGFTGMMREWEDGAVRDVNLFLSFFLGQETQPESQIFTPITHRQEIIRCLNYQEGSDICYAILKDFLTYIFVFATSSDTIKTLIDSL